MKKWIAMCILGTLLLPACTAKTATTSSDLPGNTQVEVSSISGYKSIACGMPERDASVTSYYNVATAKLRNAYEKDINTNKFATIASTLKNEDYKAWYDITWPSLEDQLSQPAEIRFLAAGFLECLKDLEIESLCPNLVAELKDIQAYSIEHTKVPQDFRAFLRFEGDTIARINLSIGARVNDIPLDYNDDVQALNNSLIKLYDATLGSSSYEYLTSGIQEAQVAIQRVVDTNSIYRPYTYVLKKILAELNDSFNEKNLAELLPNTTTNVANTGDNNGDNGVKPKNLPADEEDFAPEDEDSTETINQAPISADPNKRAEIEERKAAKARRMKNTQAAGNQAPARATPKKAAETKGKATAETKGKATAETKGKATAAAKTKASATAEKTLPSGLKYSITKAGTGKVCKKGDLVRVHYIGKLNNGMTFDSSYEGGEPLEFALGQGIVIDGWEQGIAGMKVGEERHLIVPPELAYGKNGNGPIPPNATLFFDVELLGVK